MIDKLSLLQDLSLRYCLDFFKNESARTTYTKNKKNLKNNDIFLSSYPRSGNTWMRLMLADFLLQASGIPTQTDLPVSLGQVVPDIYRDDLDEIDDRLKIPFRLIKTHEKYDRIGGFPHLVQTPKIIYLFRNPHQTLLSYSKFNKKDPDRFCAIALSEWCKNIQTHIRAKQLESKDILFISYECLKENPIDTLTRVLNFTGLSLDSSMVSQAVENHSSQKHQLKGWKGYPSDTRPNRFSQGQTVTKNELLPETVQLIESKGKSLYDRAKQLELQDMDSED